MPRNLHRLAGKQRTAIGDWSVNQSSHVFSALSNEQHGPLPQGASSLLGEGINLVIAQMYCYRLPVVRKGKPKILETTEQTHKT